MGPTGGWNVSTLSRILNNEKYIVRFVWNRTTTAKDPLTGKIKQVNLPPPQRNVTANPLSLQRSEEALDDGVVVTIAGTGSCSRCCRRMAVYGRAALGGTAIGVMQQFSLWMSRRQGGAPQRFIDASAVSLVAPTLQRTTFASPICGFASCTALGAAAPAQNAIATKAKRH